MVQYYRDIRSQVTQPDVYKRQGKLNNNAPEDCMNLVFGCDDNGNFNSVSENELA